MSDVEEPPAKLIKMEDAATPETLEGVATEDESMMEEGQEEWLSEDVLTDEDYNGGVDQDKNDSNFGNISQISQDENLPINEIIEQLDSSVNTEQDEDEKEGNQLQDNNETEENQDKEDQSSEDKQHLESDNTEEKKELEESKASGQTIEETLNDFEGAKAEVVEAMDSFVISKNNGNVIQVKPGDNVKEAKSDDDGNDTDDLLRMLGEDENKTKKKVIKMSKEAEVKEEQSTEDDDDGYVYQGPKVQGLKGPKYSVLKKYTPTIAEQENMSDGDDEKDASSDEGDTVQKIFEVKQSRNFASKSTSKSSTTADRSKRTVLKHVLEVPANKMGAKSQHSTPKHADNKNILKSKINTSLKSSPSVISQKKSESKAEIQFPKSELRKKSDPSSKKYESHGRKVESSLKPESSSRKSDSNVQLSKFDALKLEMAKLKDENEEIIDEEAFLEDEEDFELDEDEFAEESEMEDHSKGKQKIMKPESMDEEVPSDEESNSENGSLYDELPSSESEDLEDWFQLDIRAERASDYLPFLGSKARTLLLEEKQRVAARLVTLRQSLTALTDSARTQADQIRDASMTLAELDDMLKAT